MILFRMYWRRTLKKPAIVFLWGSVPFVLTTIYILAFGRSGSIAPSVLLLVDEDKSFLSGFVARAFSQGELGEYVSVSEVATLAEAEESFRNNKASGALLIPKGFGGDLLALRDVQLTLYGNPRHHFGPQILEGITDALVTIGNGLLRQFAEPMKMIGEITEKGTEPHEDEVADISRKFFAAGRAMPALESIRSLTVNVVEKDSEKEMDFNFAAYVFPGLMVFSLLFLSLSAEARFLTDRLHRLNHRIAAAPQHPVVLVLNQRLYSASFLYAVSIVCAAIGGAVWRIPASGLLEVNAIAMALILFIVGVNAAIFSTARSMKSAAGLSSFLMVALTMIGGGMMPVENYPEAVRRVAHFTPVGLANTGIVEALSGRPVSISIPGLLLYCSLFMAASIYFGRRRFARE